jgi:hypothetical protein
MISQIASVFSSQGVVLQGTERTAVPWGDDEAPQPIRLPERVDFGAVFDQAAAKLDLSSLAVKMASGPAYAEGRKPEHGPGGKAAEEGAKQRTAADPRGGGADGSGRTLTPEQQEQLAKLKERDREVRVHEEQHAARAGAYAEGGPRYEYQAGPDGKQYAVGGHVDVDTSPVQGNPQATLEKARILQQAALAPAEPSGADRSVAAQAAQMARDAARQLAEERRSGGGEASPGRPHPYARPDAPSGQFLDIAA